MKRDEKTIQYTAVDERAGIPIEVVYPGVNVEKYQSPPTSLGRALSSVGQLPPEGDEGGPTIGFFYRMSYENGLDILAQSFVKLKNENSIPGLKLKIGGGYTRENRGFINNIRNILQPYMDDVIWSDNYTLDEHPAFYKDISLICVPLRFNEAVGLYLCEAFAAGRPAVAPDTGSFGEIIQNAGVLYSPNDSEHLTEALKKILLNNTLYEKCRENALRLSHERYNDRVVAGKLLEIYRASLTSAPSSSPPAVSELAPTAPSSPIFSAASSGFPL